MSTARDARMVAAAIGRATVALCLAALLGLGCGDDDGVAPEDAPEGHTVVEDGVAHAPGLEDPEANCTACHGADLRGGAGGQPSCYTCHGAVWLEGI